VYATTRFRWLSYFVFLGVSLALKLQARRGGAARIHGLADGAASITLANYLAPFSPTAPKIILRLSKFLTVACFNKNGIPQIMDS
jgi:hypothetical protein